MTAQGAAACAAEAAVILDFNTKLASKIASFQSANSGVGPVPQLITSSSHVLIPIPTQPRLKPGSGTLTRHSQKSSIRLQPTALLTIPPTVIRVTSGGEWLFFGFLVRNKTLIRDGKSDRNNYHSSSMSEHFCYSLVLLLTQTMINRRSTDSLGTRCSSGAYWDGVVKRSWHFVMNRSCFDINKIVSHVFLHCNMLRCFHQCSEYLPN